MCMKLHVNQSKWTTLWNFYLTFRNDKSLHVYLANLWDLTHIICVNKCLALYHTLPPFLILALQRPQQLLWHVHHQCCPRICICVQINSHEKGRLNDL